LKSNVRKKAVRKRKEGNIPATSGECEIRRKEDGRRLAEKGGGGDLQYLGYMYFMDQDASGKKRKEKKYQRGRKRRMKLKGGVILLIQQRKT